MHRLAFVRQTICNQISDDTVKVNALMRHNVRINKVPMRSIFSVHKELERALLSEDIHPRKKQMMIALKSTNLTDDEYGDIIYTDPRYLYLTSLSGVRQMKFSFGMICAYGIPFGMSFLLPISWIIQLSIGTMVTAALLLKHAWKHPYKHRLYLMYHEPMHDVYTATLLTPWNTFTPIFFRLQDLEVVPDEKNKVIIKGKQYLLFSGKEAYISDHHFERIWKKNKPSIF